MRCLKPLPEEPGLPTLHLSWYLPLACHALEGGEERAERRGRSRGMDTLLFLSAHHGEERREGRDDDQRHSDGHGSDGSRPGRVH